MLDLFVIGLRTNFEEYALATAQVKPLTVEHS
jgi:hypothetical protein